MREWRTGASDSRSARDFFLGHRGVTEHELTDTVREVIEAGSYTVETFYRRREAFRAGRDPQEASGPLWVEGAAWGDLTGADLLVMALEGHGCP